MHTVFDIQEAQLGGLCMEGKRWTVTHRPINGCLRSQYCETLDEVRDYIYGKMVDWEWIEGGTTE